MTGTQSVRSVPDRCVNQSYARRGRRVDLTTPPKGGVMGFAGYFSAKRIG
jgi:hypothetical protein